MLLLMLCRATPFKDFGLGWWRRLGDLESDAQPPRRQSSVAATAIAATDDELVVFKSNADCDLAAWAWVRDFDLPGDAVE
jgi:hypothetical protein